MVNAHAERRFQRRIPLQHGTGFLFQTPRQADADAHAADADSLHVTRAFGQAGRRPLEPAFECGPGALRKAQVVRRNQADGSQFVRWKVTAAGPEVGGLVPQDVDQLEALPKTAAQPLEVLEGKPSSWMAQSRVPNFPAHPATAYAQDHVSDAEERLCGASSEA